MDLFDGARFCAEFGWKVIWLRKKAKVPVPKQWPKVATDDVEILEGKWKLNPEFNVGVLLGKDSGIIDCECDSPEEEEEYLALWDGEAPPTTSFASSTVKLKDGREYTKKHFLLKWREGLPNQAVVKLGKLTIKVGNGGKGTQSVFPPSIHPKTEKPYRWLAPPDSIEPAEITDEVLARINNWQGMSPTEATRSQGKTAAEWEKLIQGSAEGSRNVDLTSYCGWLVRNQEDLESPKSVSTLLATVSAINERNRPPLKPQEVKTIFLSILRREHERRLSSDIKTILREKPEDAVNGDGKEKDDCPFKLTIVRSEPPRYELRAPQFTKAPGGALILDAKQLISPSAIRVESLKQAEYPLPKAFDKAWTKPGGLYERVVFAAKLREAPPEEIRTAVVAERLLRLLSKASTPPKDVPLDKTDGTPLREPDGSVIFQFSVVLDLISSSADKITRLELSRVTTLAHSSRALGGGRWLRVSPLGMSKLGYLAKGVKDETDKKGEVSA